MELLTLVSVGFFTKLLYSAAVLILFVVSTFLQLCGLMSCDMPNYSYVQQHNHISDKPGSGAWLLCSLSNCLSWNGLAAFS